MPLNVYVWLAIAFGFLMAWGIGANDVSNAMGTSVGSNAISIRQAIVIAAIFEFLGAFLAGGEVTNTIRSNLINTTLLADQPNTLIIGMLASLLSAGFWLIGASVFGWPVSTTHTIVGAILGFGIVSIGFDAIQWPSISSIIMGWIFSPILGAILAYSLFMSVQYFIFNKAEPLSAAKKIVPIYIFICSWIVYMITFNNIKHIGINIDKSFSILYASILGLATALISKWPIAKLKLDPKADLKFHYTNVERIFTVLMIFTACAMAFAHGSNDVANAIGPIAAIIQIVETKTINFNASSNIPFWLLLLGGFGIVLGLSTYGYKVMATVGNKITQLTPSRGFAATLAAASTVVLASSTGLPISTTHTLVGGILGIGLARGVDALNINVIKNIFMSWTITLPIGALLSIIFFKILLIIL